jgi:hypothetical protein
MKIMRIVVLTTRSGAGMGMISCCCPAWSSWQLISACVAFSFILQINKPLQSISQSELAAIPSVKSAFLHCSKN